MKVFVGINAGNWRLGFEYAPIVHKDGGPYMTRWIIYLLWFNLRLHQFFRGDYDRASHNHPWWFITFPFTPYMERVFDCGQFLDDRIVRAWRPHFRTSKFEHIVVGPVQQRDRRFMAQPAEVWDPIKKPFWTFVIAGRPGNVWGFWSPDGVFHPYGDE